MDKLLINRDENTEIEIRIRGINSHLFRKVYDHFLKSNIQRDKIECSLNAIYNNEIRKDVYLDNNNKITTFYRKTRVGNTTIVVDKIEFNVVRSTEEKILQTKLQSGTLFRFKKRASFILREESTYRIDMTIARETTNIKEAQNIKKQLFGNIENITFENFADNFSDIRDSTKFEIEIEFIESDDDFKDYEIIINYFAGLLKENKIITRQSKYLTQLARVLGRRNNVTNLKSVTNQAKTLTKNIYKNIFPPKKYFITDKKDGIRCIVFVEMSELVFLTDLEEKKVSHNIDKAVIGSILDGELVGDKFFAFDIIKYGGKDQTHELPFNERFPLLVDCVKIINHENIKLSNLKQIGDDYEKIIKEYGNEEKREYEIDGIIITSPYENYTNTKNYKWKPIHMNTIDFLVLKCPQELMGVPPLIAKKDKILYLLFVGINNELMNRLQLKPMKGYEKIVGNIGSNYYKPIQFSPSIWPNAYIFYSDRDDLHMKICELLYTKHDWKFVKIREDRHVTSNQFGNDFAVAETILMELIDPLTFEDLYNFNKEIYFQKSNTDDSVNIVNKYNRFVITELFKQYLQNKDFVIDLASGRGADLFRYSEQNVKKVLFIEKDTTALSELIDRKLGKDDETKNQNNKNKNKKKKKNPKHRDLKLKVLAHNTDLKKDADVIMNNLVAEVGVTEFSANIVVCNFAIHYFCENEHYINNFMKLVSSLLQVNGRFIFTTFDGEKVFDLLKENKTWVTESGKFMIEKLYDDNKLKKFGQIIKVKLHFSKDGELYEEPLCNIKAVLEVANKHKLTVVEQGSFLDYMPAFEKIEIFRAHNLSEEDKTFIGLYKYVVLQKVQRKAGGGRPRRIIK